MKANGTLKLMFLAISILLCFTVPALGEGKNSGEISSTQELINPLTRRVRLAFTLNFDRDLGPEDQGEELTLLNTRLVYPFAINRNWSVISRTTFRYFGLKDFPVEGEETQGLSDTVSSLFITPAKIRKHGLLWGVGPILLLPTATDASLGTEKWGVGPTAAVNRQTDHWTFRLIASHTWSVAGSDNRADVSVTGLEPVIAYTFGRNWNVSVDSNSAYNWESDTWLVPLNLGMARRIKIGKLPLLVSGAGRYWIESPDAGPEGFGFRFSVVLQFPKAS